MSYVTFMGHGAHGPLQRYRRDYYEKDIVSSVGTSHKYDGKITSMATLSTSPTKEILIDQAVKVTTVADKVRTEAKKMWSSLQKGCLGSFTATLIVGITAGIAAIAVGAALPVLWPVAVAVGVFALVMLGIAGWNIARSIEAKEQLAKWADPVPGYQKQRMMAEQKGFYHAFSSGYKGKIVSGEELESLWFKGMDQWADKYDSHIHSLEKAKVQDIRRFMEECPLQGKALEQAFEDSEIPEDAFGYLKKLSSKYASLKSQYDSIRMETEALKKQIRNERTTALLRNDEELRINLLPYDALIRSQKLALISQHDHYNRIIVTYETGISRMQPTVSYPARYPQVGINASVGPAHITATVGGHVIPGSGRGPRHHMPMVGTHVVHGHPATVMTTTPVIHVVPQHVAQARAELLILNAKLAQLDSVYYAMTAPIRNLHAHNKTKIEQWASSELGRIQTGEDKTMMKFYKPIKALLLEYKNRNVEDKPEEVEPEPKIAVGINTKAPELRKDFEVPQYDKSWSQFIAEVDWEKGIVKKTVVEHKGNTTSETTTYS